MAINIKLDGDPKGGWMGEIHDGVQLHTYSPDGEAPLPALLNMLRGHFAPAMAAPPPVAPPPAEPAAKTEG